MFDFPYKSLILATPSDACGERLITAPMLHSFSIYFYLNRRRDKRSWKPLRMDRGYRNGTPSIMAWFAFIPSVYMLVFRFHITWWNTQVSWTCTWGWFFVCTLPCLIINRCCFREIGDLVITDAESFLVAKSIGLLIRLRWLFSSYLSILYFILKLWIVIALGKSFNSKSQWKWLKYMVIKINGE